MSDYPMLISNKLHSFRNFKMQKYKNNIDKHIRAKFYQGSCTKIRNHSKKVSSSM